MTAAFRAWVLAKGGNMARRLFGLLSYATLTSCGPYTDIGSRFEILDGGGSKQSLTKDRIVLISYTVTGIGRLDDDLIIELRAMKA